MTTKNYIVAFDQGTTSSRTLIFNHQGEIVAMAQQGIKQIYPHPGWIEHDANDILQSQLNTLSAALQQADISANQIQGLGITNQRETTVIWNKHTGQPIYNAIVWQCRRTTAFCEQLKQQDPELNRYIKTHTGLVLDPYFCASKIKWILDNVANAREQAEAGDLLFGTIDTWLLWQLTEGQVHATDYTNASRTLLFNIDTLSWDPYLLDKFGIAASLLPEVKPSSGFFGEFKYRQHRIPITSLVGDQQAALFGHLGVKAGQLKNTYGTGCFLLMHTGASKVQSDHGLLTTLACGPKGEPQYALEGSVFMGGATMQWLRDEMQLFEDVSQTSEMAKQAASANKVYMVPAFTGIGAPYWQPNARGTLVGLTRGTQAKHIVRASLESIAYQTYDVLCAMQSDANLTLKQMKVDGGASSNDFLMQFQADLLNIPVLKPNQTEVTALGAAYLAGLAVGFWSSFNALEKLNVTNEVFIPHRDPQKRTARLKGWHNAIQCAQLWAQLNQAD
ncbi:glycerol kinase GlpK [Motilimonas eburnea]|uniref:glycerol kinase GlpK n=1 Tax=Motilimonas eburnea TaxID=1737488 RepID=UPI001E490C5D|nr:glycerol kinase GlpK [Motilimonas eburnea]MCE2570868.1 glycerol kinase GlpK [Motilimonas eburnea]